MPFAIIAEFPLGMYRAHRADGLLDALPSPARLHAALLAAAGLGMRAERDGDRLQPNAADRAALEWLEAHIPDGIVVPSTIARPDTAIAFRAEGFFGMRKGRRSLVTRSDTIGGVTISGALGWLWDEPPPDDIAQALTALCADVSHLGTADSPVVLRVGEMVATHRMDPAASPFAGGGLDVEVPRPGRTRILETEFARQSRREPPKDESPRKGGEEARTAPVLRAATALVRYTSTTEGPSAIAPWSLVVVLPVDDHLPEESRVAWSVALHRALVSLIGDGAPSLVTGRYEPGVARPANRLAIHYIPGVLVGPPVIPGPGAFALLVPDDADPADLAAVERAVRSLREIRLGGRRLVVRHEPRTVQGSTFWRPVPSDHVRVWRTEVPAVSEARPPRGSRWSIGHAAILALGLVFRDRFPRPSRRGDWHIGLVDAVVKAGVGVLDAHKLHRPGAHRFVHRIATETPIQPYRAVLSLGTLAGERTILAIGQSRHLGGGLLVPLDIPAAVIRETAEELNW